MSLHIIIYNIRNTEFDIIAYVPEEKGKFCVLTGKIFILGSHIQE